MNNTTLANKSFGSVPHVPQANSIQFLHHTKTFRYFSIKYSLIF